MGMLFERLGLMKVNRHKSFEIEPRFYDERKERLQSMKDRHSIVESDTDEHKAQVIKERMRQSVADKWSFSAEKQKQARSSNIRLVVILLLILAGTYYIFNFLENPAEENKVINIDNQQ